MIVVGATNAGLDLAGRAADAGLGDVAVMDVAGRPPPPRTATRHHLQVHYGAEVTQIRADPDAAVVVTADGELRATVVAVAAAAGAGRVPDAVPDSVADRLHGDLGEWAEGGLDVLVVADGEAGAQAAIDLVGGGASVVVAFQPGSLRRLSRTSQLVLAEYEVERRVTLLWHGALDAVEDMGGYPMVFFADRQTPDLQFDHVLFATGVEQAVGSDVAAAADAPPGRVVVLADGVAGDGAGAVMTVPLVDAWNAIRELHFPDLAEVPQREATWIAGRDVGELREQHYNATITHFDPHHSDLWVLRVRPDHGDVSHLPGQYTTLGLGYWEPRIDPAEERLDDQKRQKLIRRSYSISSPIFDDSGYLVDPHTADELEFYIVRVPPTASRVPALTPRLALKHPGDRIFLGPKMAGRYTLAPVIDPGCAVVFVASGTGEAPHNAMVGRLLSRGHHGPIVSVVSVRYENDLGYAAAHRRLEERYPNYRYLPLVTRDPDVPKRYAQDVIADGTLAELTGGLEPGSCHVFMCGNPAMLGAPHWTDARPAFPEPTGVAELLHQRGFTLDRRGTIGDVHFEAFW